MSLTYGLKTARDLLAKLSRDASLLKGEVSSDRFFNFVVTAYALVDWVQNDPFISQPAKDALSSFRSTDCIKICRDLANASKHFALDPEKNPNPKVSSADSKRGYDVGRYGRGGFGVGEELITITIDDGSKKNILDLVDEILQAWEGFFTQHKLSGI